MLFIAGGSMPEIGSALPPLLIKFKSPAPEWI